MRVTQISLRSIRFFPLFSFNSTKISCPLTYREGNGQSVHWQPQVQDEYFRTTPTIKNIYLFSILCFYLFLKTMDARISQNTRLSKKKGSCRISIVCLAWLLGNTYSPHWNPSRLLLHAVQPPRNHGQKPS